MKRTLLALIAAIVSLGSAGPLSACTSAVISGKVTPDGRPLLWKNDWPVAGDEFHAYPFVAVVNSVEDNPTDVWIGTNAAGFSIMNTQSYNLVEVKPGEERGEANGRVMRRALEVCATVKDFCQFLDTLSKPSLIEANFGVIDAKGGAAMFEVDYYEYVMYDANNPKRVHCTHQLLFFRQGE